MSYKTEHRAEKTEAMLIKTKKDSKTERVKFSFLELKIHNVICPIRQNAEQRRQRPG